MPEIFKINANKIVLSDRVTWNNGKDWQYIRGYQVDGETIVTLFIKAPKNIFSYDTSQYNKNWAYSMWFIISQVQEVGASLSKHMEQGWATAISKADNVERIYQEKFSWFRLLNGMYCNVTPILNVNSV